MAGSYTPGLYVGPPGQLVPHGDDTWYFEVDPGPTHVAALDRAGQAWTWDGDFTPVAGVPPAPISVASMVDGVVVGAKSGALVRLGDTPWTVPGESGVTDLARSPDGAWLAVGRLDGTVELRQAADGALLARFEGHTERVARVAFDGLWLVSGSWDRTVRVWGLHDIGTPAEALISSAFAAWPLSLEQVLGAQPQGTVAP